MASLEGRLRGADPDLVYDEALTPIPGLLDQLVVTVEAAVDGPGDVGSVEGVGDLLAKAVHALPQRTEVPSVSEVDAYKADIRALRAEVAELLGQTTGEIAARSAEVEQIASRIDEVAASLPPLALQVDELLATKDAELAVELDRIRQQGADTDAALRTQVNGFVEQQGVALEGTLADRTVQFDELIANQTEEAHLTLAVLGDLLEEARKVVGAIGRTGLSGGFQQWGDSEKKSANQMRITSIVFGVLAALSIVAVLLIREFHGDPDKVSLARTLGAVSIPAAFGAVAAYTGRESSKHRRNFVIARRTELELASFGPYLATLTGEEQRSLTAMFAPVFFGQSATHAEEPDHNDQNTPRPIVTELMSQAAKAVRGNQADPP